jgi:cellulose synthase/poly-beta-1,6-N-acetylglucosamine synthase-like glycosyltransferase
MKISVVIPAYNEERYIRNTLEALSSQSCKPDEIIVVDNASSDKTAQIAKKLGAKLVFEPKRGVAWARQAGFCAACGEIIVSTDADSIFPKDWLLKIKKEFSKNPKLVGLSGPIWPIDSTWQEKVLFSLHTISNFWQYFFGLSFFTGQNFAVLKSVFESSGGFKPGSPSSEEGDLFNKIKYLGQVKYLPSLVVQVSNRRVRKVGFTRMVWWSIKAWLSLHFQILARPKLQTVRHREQKSEEIFDQVLCLLIIFGALVFFSLAYGFLLPLALLLVGRFVFAKPPRVVLKRALASVSVFFVGVLPISIIFFSQTSFAQGKVIPNLKQKIESLKIDERFKNLTDIQIIEKISQENLFDLLQK